MKKVFNKVVRFLNTNKLISIALLFIVIGIAFSFSNAFGQLSPIKSIEIFSEKLDYTNKEPGAWKITKSSRWSGRGTAEITFDLETILKTNNKNTDILFVLDVSGSMTGNKLDRVKTDSAELIESLLSNDKNKAGLITFDTNSTIVSELTNNKELLINRINNLSTGGTTNYYQALINVDSILKNYTKEKSKEFIVLFLTDGYPNENTPNEVGFYKYLKSAYPYATFNAVQYEMGSTILEPIKKVSDNQYLADMETLNNVLFDASVAAIIYDNFEISDFIDTRYFYVDSDKDIKTDTGKIIFDKTSQKVTWKLDNFKSGLNAKLTIKVRLKTEFVGEGGIYPTNEHEEVRSKIEEIEENVNSKETPVLADNYKVKYEANVPEGCTLEGIVPEERSYSVYDTVEISENNPICEGYQFKGWDIVTKSAKKINDNYFTMPDENVTIRGNWSRLALSKSMNGTVKEVLTLYKQVQNDVKDSTKYAKKYTGDTSTFKGDKEIYYYYGAASNNNVLFANYCWKIIRTTDTGGVKLLYNGVPDVNGACNNEKGNSALTKEQMGTDSNKVAFNLNYYSPADVGYMNNVRYERNFKVFTTGSSTIINIGTMSNSESYNYYYSDAYTYTSSEYTMDTPTQYTWTDNYENLVGKYTCRSASESITSCSRIYYVAKAESGKMYYITLLGGRGITDSGYETTVTFSDEVTLNEDGIYTLINPVIINKADWNTKYGKYINYYTCGSNVITCNARTMEKVESTSSTGYWYISGKDTYKYGNSFTWDGTNYTLTDTVDSIGIPSDINMHHYTCWDTSGVCNKLNYIYYGSSPPYYITLSDGKSVEDALNEMLYSDNVNTENSTIKTAIDYWYANNMIEYTPYLEDTVWCNDRSMGNQSRNGWNPNGGLTSQTLDFKSASDKTNLTCKNKNDRFTVSDVNGNGALTYPVSLIDATEVELALNINNSKSPHASGNNYWSLSPMFFSSYTYDSAASGYSVNSLGNLDYFSLSAKTDIRPAVSLRADIEYSSGDGSSDKPYVISSLPDTFE